MSAPLSFDQIRDEINAEALELCKKYLPNGRREGEHWAASNIMDSGKGGSLRVNIGKKPYGKWFDFASGEKGDMLDLIRVREGLIDMGDVVRKAKFLLGHSDEWAPGRQISPVERERLAAEQQARSEAADAEYAAQREAKAARAKALWLGGRPIEGSPAEAYLVGRGLAPLPRPRGGARWPGSLRWHPTVTHGKAGVKIPAMLAAAYDAQGQHRATHRTFLDRNVYNGWGKFQAGDAKMVMGPISGAFIPISKGASGKSMRDAGPEEPFYITEGIEDALVVAMHRPELRVIAAYSLGNLGEIVFPSAQGGAGRRLVLVCDRDSNVKAQAHLERSIAKQQARGNTIDLIFPPEPYKDMNDWWLIERARAQDAAA